MIPLRHVFFFFFFNDTAPTEIYPLPLHDALPISALFAQAQDWPASNIRWVVPYPPGGGTDVLARTVAEAMRQTLNQTIVVDNRPGASTNIGAQIVATAKPDGYTIMSADNAVLAYNEHLFSKLSFNPEKDFTYIGGISRFPMALVVNPNFEAKTFKEFLAYVKAHPGQVNYASPGNGSPHHLAMEMFKNRTGTFLTQDRKSTRLNSSHSQISYAVFCLKKKKIKRE